MMLTCTTPRSTILSTSPVHSRTINAMAIEKIPPEVLTTIIGYLLVPEGQSSSGLNVKLGDLRNARLVCRQWNTVASTFTFRNVALLHPVDGKDFSKFKQLTASPTVQHAAQCVDIFSGPHHYPRDMVSDRCFEVWEDWENGEYEEFTSAIDCIADLPNLRAVRIRFDDGCNGDPEPDYYWETGVEIISTRLHTLEAVFKAMQTRAARGVDHPGTFSPIMSLTIQNLQNKPIPDFVSTDLFKSVAKNITEVRLLVAHEYNEAGPDRDLDCEDRRTFEPWLQSSLLPFFANQITNLHLAFNEHWGVAPGYFDGKGLGFPHLKTLTLGKFVIGHHDQFDWVLRQKTIETLRLDRCVIASYLTFLRHSDEEDQLAEWAVPTHDWERYPEWAFGLHDIHVTFSFSGAWEAVFDAIRTSLPNLVDFRMENPPRRVVSHFNSAEQMRCMLTPLRYTTLDTGLLPSPWILPGKELTGEMEFGNGDPTVLPPEERGDMYVKKGELNRAAETLVGDTRAFEDLVKTVKEKRQSRGSQRLTV